jgi:flagellar FliL protein
MAEETSEEVKSSGGGNKGMLIVLIILIVVLLAAVGGLGYFMYSKGVFNDQPAQTAQTTQQEQASPQVNEGETYKGDVDSLVLNITDAKGRAKLMKLSFTLKTTEPKIEAVLDETKAEIVDSVIRQVSARTSEELLTVGGKAMLKEEMIDEINNIINDSIPEGDTDRPRNPVLDLYFTSFVIK